MQFLFFCFDILSTIQTNVFQLHTLKYFLGINPGQTDITVLKAILSFTQDWPEMNEHAVSFLNFPPLLQAILFNEVITATKYIPTVEGWFLVGVSWRLFLRLVEFDVG